MNYKSIEEMKNVDIKSVNPNELVDLESIMVSNQHSKEERINNYIEQIKNPYCFRVGKIIVKVDFTEGGRTFQENLESALKAM